MTVLQPGRVCVITRGADAGKAVVVKQVVDKNFAIIVGECVKERRANIAHLEPTPRTSAVPTGPAPKQRAAPAAKQAGDKTVANILRKVKKEEAHEKKA